MANRNGLGKAKSAWPPQCLGPSAVLLAGDVAATGWGNVSLQSDIIVLYIVDGSGDTCILMLIPISQKELSRKGDFL